MPFIDLVSFTLRYAVNKISRSKYNEESNIIYPEENFNEIVGDDYKLHLFASFSTLEACLYEDICKQFHSIDKKYDLNIFDYHLRISSMHSKRWDSTFIKENLSYLSARIQKVFIVGPVPFMHDIKKSLENTGVASGHKIFLV